MESSASASAAARAILISAVVKKLFDPAAYYTQQLLFSILSGIIWGHYLLHDLFSALKAKRIPSNNKRGICFIAFL
jgi:hypothetical protein